MNWPVKVEKTLEVVQRELEVAVPARGARFKKPAGAAAGEVLGQDGHPEGGQRQEEIYRPRQVSERHTVSVPAYDAVIPVQFASSSRFNRPRRDRITIRTARMAAVLP